MHSTDNLLIDPKARSLRVIEKQKMVLRFLRQHIWSNQTVLQKVLQFKSRQATHRTLCMIESNGFIRRHTFAALGGNITIWGITNQGQSVAFDLSSEEIIPISFDPKRVSEQTIRHQLDLQILRLKAEENGWKFWQDGDRIKINKSQKRPDAITQNSNGKIIAVECERSYKSLKRYEQILISYLMLIKNGSVNEAVWVCPTEEMAKRLEKIFKSIRAVRINGEKVQIDPERHHSHLHFCNYEEWPRY